jgi:predicted glycosyltransferase
LVRLFSQKPLRDKLVKEYGYLFKQSSEIETFNEQFKLLKKLWMTKLSTPLEEVLSVQESLQKLR